MASLKALQKKVPGAETVAGRVIAFHGGKHLDLGKYVGEDAVVLSKVGEEIMSPKKIEGNKLVPAKGLDLDDLEV